MEMGEGEHVLVVNMHHIISDGWSIGVLIGEVSRSYERVVSGVGEEERELAVQYLDYAEWQREWLKGEVLERQLGYWRERLAGAPEVLELPTDRPRPESQSFAGAWDYGLWPKDLSHELRRFSKNEKVTLFMTTFAAFNVLLHYYTKATDIVLGTDVANRNRIESEGLIGFFVNQLVLRSDLSGDPDFRELLTRVRSNALKAYANQDLPFHLLVKELKTDRDQSHNPIFQVLFVLHNDDFAELKMGQLEFDFLELDQRTAAFDISLHLWDRPEGIKTGFRYNTSLFNPETIAEMSEFFRAVIRQIIEEPHTRLSRFTEILTVLKKRGDDEKRKQLKKIGLQTLKRAGRKASK
jgi:hypothetical protein